MTVTWIPVQAPIFVPPVADARHVYLHILQGQGVEKNARLGLLVRNLVDLRTMSSRLKSSPVKRVPRKGGSKRKQPAI